MRFSFLFVILLACISFAQQKELLTVEFNELQSTVPAYRYNSILYVDLKALSEEIHLGYSEKNSGEIVTLSGKNYNLRISSNNAFIASLKKNGEIVKTYQVPVPTHVMEKNVFIPLIYSLRIFNDILGTRLKYNSEKRIITAENDLAGIYDVSSFDISTLNVEEKANGTLIKISSRQIIPAYKSSYKDGIITLLLRGVKTNPAAAQNFPVSGLIKQVDIKNTGDDCQILFHVGPDYSASEVLKDDNGLGIILTIHNKVFSSREQEKLKEKWNFDVIVLDAGHGGKDAGAVGVNGIFEKDINLAITLALGKIIKEQMPGVKVEYTRDDDSFVELYKRGRIANEKDGKLFISVHCNATADRSGSASGFEVYLLRPGRTQEAISIAERENSVIEFEDDPKRYQQLNDENFILVSMAQASYMKYSEKFAEYLDNKFSSGSAIPCRGVKQAGFYVLVGASMPGVLIESGFLSNKNDALYLNSKKGQERTAELIFEGIKDFKSYYESSF